MVPGRKTATVQRCAKAKASKRKVAPTASKGKSRGAAKGIAAKEVGTIASRLVSDDVVAGALSDILAVEECSVRTLMRRWKKPILKTSIPGRNGQVPTQAMLAVAKAAVRHFLDVEEALGERSQLVQAFRLASGECSLQFMWSWAKQRVRRAKLDLQENVDSWQDCYAMVSGSSNAQCEIYVCGKRKLSLRALTSLVCHESLHNLARRTRRGNPFLGEDTEHVAMALLGDPQLVNW